MLATFEALRLLLGALGERQGFWNSIGADLGDKDKGMGKEENGNGREFASRIAIEHLRSGPSGMIQYG